MLNDPRLRAWADPLLRRIGLYSAYEITEQEYIGKTGPHVRAWLEREYDRSPRLLGVSLEAAKYHWRTGDVHDVSVRKIDAENPRKQYHVHGWEIRDRVYALASHHEYRPDLRLLGGETPADAVERLRTHFCPSWGSDYFRGKAPDDLLCKL